MSTQPEADSRTSLGPIGRARQSLAALQALERIRTGETPTPEDMAALNGWHGWGPMAPALESDATGTWAEIGQQIKWLLSPADYIQAGNATYNAFYTPQFIVDTMWQTLRDLGFSGGIVLEPGCGDGRFMSSTPDGVQAEWIGVDRDPTAAAIAALRNPAAKIFNKPLQEMPLPSRSVDAVLGNVPYGDVKVHDPTAPAQVTTNLHNYFIWRSVQALRPGGVAILLTSRYTLDAHSQEAQAARWAIAADADLLGAIRLTNQALNPGGTDALADILVLRRRLPHEEVDQNPVWLGTKMVLAGAGQLNNYFEANPQMILGTLTEDKAPQHGRTLRVDPDPNDPPVAVRLAEAGRDVAAEALAAGQGWNVPPAPGAITLENYPFPVREDGRKEASYHLVGGAPHQVVDGEMVKVARAGKELPRLIEMRDAAIALIERDADHSIPDEDLVVQRAALHTLYTKYVAAFGPLNRFTESEGKPDEETGVPTIIRRRPRMGGFRHDPDFVTVLALENFDDDTKTAEPAALLTRRVNRPREPVTRASSPAEALALCRDRHNRIDISVIAELLDIDPAQVPEQLKGLAWIDPTTDAWVPTDEYLSGNVRAKLEAARAAAAADPDRWADHVEALAEVVPADVGAEELFVNLGAVWIPAADIEDFAAEVIGFRPKIWREKRFSNWTVEASNRAKESAQAIGVWGTERINAYELLERKLNGKAATVYDVFTTPDGGERRVKNEDQTQAAEDKTKDLNTRFAAWLWEDPDRTDRLLAEYNRVFNSTVPRNFDGSYLTFHGIDPDFTPYSHQSDMVARMIAPGNALCPYPVGTGKTATMFMGAMKLKELGLVRKPMLVVLPATLEQIARDGKRLFPTARILMATKDDLADARSRKLFAARCATEEWDAVVMSHTAFKAIPVHPTTEAAYLDQIADDYRQALASADPNGDKRKIKQISKMVDNLEARARGLLAHAVDDGTFFEHLGVDYLMVDEIHFFKNLGVPVHTDGFSIKPSQRATDLDMKLIWMQQANDDGRTLTGFSGTMLTNTLLEIYVMQRYAMRQRLIELGIDSADAWAATWVNFETNPEITPDGNFRLKRRPVDFNNAQELINILGEVTEMRPKDSFPVVRPNAHHITVVVEPTEGQLEYMEQLGERADDIAAGGVDPETDNMLKICTDGRNVALHESLIGQEPTGSGKVEKLVEMALEYYVAHKDELIEGDDSGVPGRLQIAFVSRGTPHPKKGLQLYGIIRDQLIAGGMPAHLIRIAHDAKTDAARLALWDDCNSGKVAFLLGSISKVGVGVNAQRRAGRSYIVDPPLRPDEIEQAEGRVWRPKNLLTDVELIRMGTESTFDAFTYQGNERKQRSIDQVFSGRAVGRSLEEIGEVTMNFAQIKAAITGNPILLQQVEARREMRSLSVAASNHSGTVKRLRNDIDKYHREIRFKSSTATALETIAAVAATNPAAGWEITAGRDMQPGPIPTDDVPTVLADITSASLERGVWMANLAWRGLTMDIDVQRQHRDVEIFARLTGEGPDGAQRINIPIRPSWLGKGQHWRIVEAITGAVDGAEERAAQLRQETEELRERIAENEQEAAKPFPKTAELEAARVRLEEINEAVRAVTAEAEQKRQARRERQVAAAADATAGDVTGEPADATAAVTGGPVSTDPAAGPEPPAVGAVIIEPDAPAGDFPPYPDRTEHRDGEAAVVGAFLSWRANLRLHPTLDRTERDLRTAGESILVAAASRQAARYQRGRDEDADLDIGPWRELRSAAVAVSSLYDRDQRPEQQQDRIAWLLETNGSHIARFTATLGSADSYVAWASSPEPDPALFQPVIPLIETPAEELPDLVARRTALEELVADGEGDDAAAELEQRRREAEPEPPGAETPATDAAPFDAEAWTLNRIEALAANADLAPFAVNPRNDTRDVVPIFQEAFVEAAVDLVDEKPDIHPSFFDYLDDAVTTIFARAAIATARVRDAAATAQINVALQRPELAAQAMVRIDAELAELAALGSNHIVAAVSTKLAELADPLRAAVAQGTTEPQATTSLEAAATGPEPGSEPQHQEEDPEAREPADTTQASGLHADAGEYPEAGDDSQALGPSGAEGRLAPPPELIVSNTRREAAAVAAMVYRPDLIGRFAATIQPGAFNEPGYRYAYGLVLEAYRNDAPLDAAALQAITDQEMNREGVRGDGARMYRAFVEDDLPRWITRFGENPHAPELIVQAAAARIITDPQGQHNRHLVTPLYDHVRPFDWINTMFDPAQAEPLYIALLGERPRIRADVAVVQASDFTDPDLGAAFTALINDPARTPYPLPAHLQTQVDAWREYLPEFRTHWQRVMSDAATWILARGPRGVPVTEPTGELRYPTPTVGQDAGHAPQSGQPEPEEEQPTQPEPTTGNTQQDHDTRPHEAAADQVAEPAIQEVEFDAFEQALVIRHAMVREELPQLVRVMDNPAALWAFAQALTDSGRGYVPFRQAEGYHRRTDPTVQGLTGTRTTGTERVRGTVAWAELPAWIANGLSQPLKEQLLAEDARYRALLAPPFILQDHTAIAQARDSLEATVAAVHDAIAAAGPPSAEQLAEARRGNADPRPQEPAALTDTDIRHAALALIDARTLGQLVVAGDDKSQLNAWMKAQPDPLMTSHYGERPAEADSIPLFDRIRAGRRGMQMRVFAATGNREGTISWHQIANTLLAAVETLTPDQRTAITELSAHLAEHRFDRDANERLEQAVQPIREALGAEGELAAADPQAAADGPVPEFSTAEIVLTINTVLDVEALPQFVRAMDDPAMLWACAQGLANSGRGNFFWTHDDPDNRDRRQERRADPTAEGLYGLRAHPNRATYTVPWAEVPAWIATGMADTLRQNLLEADARYQQLRRLPRAQQDRDALTEARNAVGEATLAIHDAIAAAEPPTLEQLAAARQQNADPRPADTGVLTAADIRHTVATMLTATSLGRLVEAGDDPQQLRAWTRSMPGKPEMYSRFAERFSDQQGGPGFDKFEKVGRGVQLRAFAPGGNRQGTVTWRRIIDEVRAVLTPQLETTIAEISSRLADHPETNATDHQRQQWFELRDQLTDAAQPVYDALSGAPITDQPGPLGDQDPTQSITTAPVLTANDNSGPTTEPSQSPEPDTEQQPQPTEQDREPQPEAATEPATAPEPEPAPEPAAADPDDQDPTPVGEAEDDDAADQDRPVDPLADQPFGAADAARTVAEWMFTSNLYSLLTHPNDPAYLWAWANGQAHSGRGSAYSTNDDPTNPADNRRSRRADPTVEGLVGKRWPGPVTGIIPWDELPAWIESSGLTDELRQSLIDAVDHQTALRQLPADQRETNALSDAQQAVFAAERAVRTVLAAAPQPTEQQLADSRQRYADPRPAQVRPLTDTDIRYAIYTVVTDRSLGRLVQAIDDPAALRRWARQQPGIPQMRYHFEERDPAAGGEDSTGFDKIESTGRGLWMRVFAPGGNREGTVTWSRIIDEVRAVITPQVTAAIAEINDISEQPAGNASHQLRQWHGMLDQVREAVQPIRDALANPAPPRAQQESLFDGLELEAASRDTETAGPAADRSAAQGELPRETDNAAAAPEPAGTAEDPAAQTRAEEPGVQADGPASAPDAAPDDPAPVIDEDRQSVLIQAIVDHAARYSAPHNQMVNDPARYVAEGHVPGGATAAETAWIAAYIAEHPEVRTLPVLTFAELAERDRAAATERAERVERARQLSRQSREAFDAGDYRRALDLIEQARRTEPRARGDWDSIRTRIIERMQAPAGTLDAPGDTGQQIQTPGRDAEQTDTAAPAAPNASAAEQELWLASRAMRFGRDPELAGLATSGQRLEQIEGSFIAAYFANALGPDAPQGMEQALGDMTPAQRQELARTAIAVARADAAEPDATVPPGEWPRRALAQQLRDLLNLDPLDASETAQLLLSAAESPGATPAAETPQTAPETAPSRSAHDGSLLDVVRASAAVTEVRGYFQPSNRPQDPQVPTVMDVESVIRGTAGFRPGDVEAFEDVYARPDIAQVAADVVAWMGQGGGSQSQYRQRLAAIAETAGPVAQADYPIVVSAVNTWRIEQARAQREARVLLDAERSGHVGAVGDRIAVEVVVDGVIDNGKTTYTAPGRRTRVEHRRMLRVRDDDGNVLVWFTTTASVQMPSPGDRIVLTGTVSKHGEHQGVAQTQLTRCRWRPIEAPAQAEPGLAPTAEAAPAAFASWDSLIQDGQRIIQQATIWVAGDTFNQLDNPSPANTVPSNDDLTNAFFSAWNTQDNFGLLPPSAITDPDTVLPVAHDAWTTAVRATAELIDWITSNAPDTPDLPQLIELHRQAASHRDRITAANPATLEPSVAATAGRDAEAASSPEIEQPQRAPDFGDSLGLLAGERFDGYNGGGNYDVLVEGQRYSFQVRSVDDDTKYVIRRWDDPTRRTGTARPIGTAGTIEQVMPVIREDVRQLGLVTAAPVPASAPEQSSALAPEDSPAVSPQAAGAEGEQTGAEVAAHRFLVRNIWSPAPDQVAQDPQYPDQARPALHHAACQHCDFQGPLRDSENQAVEDGYDHTHPTWRQMPVVARLTGSDTPAPKKRTEQYDQLVRQAYPDGWFESGGPLLTGRRLGGTRHIPGEGPGRYDMAGYVYPSHTDAPHSGIANNALVIVADHFALYDPPPQTQNTSASQAEAEGALFDLTEASAPPEDPQQEANSQEASEERGDAAAATVQQDADSQASYVAAIQEYIRGSGIERVIAGMLGEHDLLAEWTDRGRHRMWVHHSDISGFHAESRAKGLNIQINGSEVLVPWDRIIEGIRSSLTADLVSALVSTSDAHRAMTEDWHLAINDPQAWQAAELDSRTASDAAVRAVLNAVHYPERETLGRAAQPGPDLFGPQTPELAAMRELLRQRRQPQEPTYAPVSDVQLGSILVIDNRPFVVQSNLQRGGTVELVGTTNSRLAPPFHPEWREDVRQVFSDPATPVQLAPVRNPAAQTVPGVESQPQPQAAREEAAEESVASDSPTVEHSNDSPAGDAAATPRNAEQEGVSVADTDTATAAQRLALTAVGAFPLEAGEQEQRAYTADVLAVQDASVGQLIAWRRRLLAIEPLDSGLRNTARTDVDADRTFTLTQDARDQVMDTRIRHIEVELWRRYPRQMLDLEAAFEDVERLPVMVPAADRDAAGSGHDTFEQAIAAVSADPQFPEYVQALRQAAQTYRSQAEDLRESQQLGVDPLPDLAGLPPQLARETAAATLGGLRDLWRGGADGLFGPGTPDDVQQAVLGEWGQLGRAAAERARDHQQRLAASEQDGATSEEDVEMATETSDRIQPDAELPQPVVPAAVEQSKQPAQPLGDLTETEVLLALSYWLDVADVVELARIGAWDEDNTVDTWLQTLDASENPNHTVQIPERHLGTAFTATADENVVEITAVSEPRSARIPHRQVALWLRQGFADGRGEALVAAHAQEQSWLAGPRADKAMETRSEGIREDAEFDVYFHMGLGSTLPGYVSNQEQWNAQEEERIRQSAQQPALEEDREQDGRQADEPEFDFFRDVIGDDIVFGGVVYSSDAYTLDSEGIRELTPAEQALRQALRDHGGDYSHPEVLAASAAVTQEQDDAAERDRLMDEAIREFEREASEENEREAAERPDPEPSPEQPELGEAPDAAGDTTPSGLGAPWTRDVAGPDAAQVNQPQAGLTAQTTGDQAEANVEDGALWSVDEVLGEQVSGDEVVQAVATYWEQAEVSDRAAAGEADDAGDLNVTAALAPELTEAARHGVEFNQAPEWRAIQDIWADWDDLYGGVRGGVRDPRAIGEAPQLTNVVRRMGIRVADGIANLADRLAGRLARAGRTGSAGYRAISALRDAARTLAGRLRGDDPAQTWYELGQRHNAEQLTAAMRNADDRYAAALEATRDRLAPQAPQLDFPEFDELWPVQEAIGNAAEHAREYNGAPEYRRLRELWPQATRILGAQRQAVERFGNDLINQARTQGVLRTGALRTVWNVADLAEGMANRLERHGRTDSAGHRAMIAVRDAADGAARALRRPQPSAEYTERAAAIGRVEAAFTALQSNLDRHFESGSGADWAATHLPLGEPQEPHLNGGGNGNGPADRTRQNTVLSAVRKDGVEL